MKVLKHIFLYLVFDNVDISIFQKLYYKLKKPLHLFHVTVCSNGLLNYNFQYEPFRILSTLDDVLSGTKHEGSLDADDSIVLPLSFLIFLNFGERF